MKTKVNFSSLLRLQFMLAVLLLTGLGMILSLKHFKSRSVASDALALRDAVADAQPPTELQKLFNQGVDAYVRRDFGGARIAFSGMLRLDPDNLEAKNALRRVTQELP